MRVTRLEKDVGIEVYGTSSLGIGGWLKQFPEDFKVEELLSNGWIAQIEPSAIPQIEGRGRYLVCVLVKRRLDTFRAIQTVIRKLNLTPERVEFAGIKDTQALTAQHVSISRILPEQLPTVRLADLWLYPVAFSGEKIHSGLLAGNYFRIAVRAVCHSRAATAERISSISDELVQLGGCLNFYGHQRFGTVRSITHVVGKHIILGQWENAAIAFLAKPSLFEHQGTRLARERLWNTQDYSEAVRVFPSGLFYERLMLRHLAKHSRDFVGAFCRLPVRLCRLFVQAYQSYLFNRFLSQRVRRELPLVRASQGECKVDVSGREQLALPLVGFRQSFSVGEQGEIERQIIEEEGVKLADFKVPSMARIGSPGGLRPSIALLTGLNVGIPQRDDVNPDRVMVNFSFALSKGSYATVVLREFMKPGNIVKAGF